MSERLGGTALPLFLPIFPLTGVLLLPRGRLPLNIFEPRYLAMTRDALGGARLIGMVQPSDPQDDNRGGGGPNPPVYPVGCAGRVTQFSETDDGRFLITPSTGGLIKWPYDKAGTIRVFRVKHSLTGTFPLPKGL